MYVIVLISLIIIQTFCSVQKFQPSDGMLYPRQSETREVVPLDGIWNFVHSPEHDLLAGFREKWYKKELKKVCISLRNTHKQKF